MAEPRPDIHELFCHYNSLYFRDALGTCIISWAPCLTSMEASCDCLEEGLCEIQLSVPLLKDRSSSDLKNILLHEMIHAFLWIKHKNNNHSDHGSEFLNIANSINSNLKNDYQRPSNGYNIIPRHGFQNEVNTCSVNLQKCASSGDLIEGRMDEEPSFSDCIEKNGCDTYCGNLLYEFDKHKRPFPDRLEVVDDAAGYKDKDKGKSIGVQGNERKKQRDSSHLSREARPEQLLAEEIKDKRVIKRPRIMADYLLSGDDKPKNLPKKPSQPDYSNSTELHITDLRTRSVAMGPDIPRQPRTTCKKVYNLCNNTEEIKYTERVREISFVIQQFDVYRDTESEEELQPLVNKRSEGRKKMKMFNNSDGNGEQTIAPTSHEVISLD